MIHKPSFTTIILSAWAALVAWFETGDLVPLLVIVSAVHYSTVLAGKDAWPVAIAIGVLVDLGHYRWVRAAARYGGAVRWEAVTRWAWAVLFTAMSLAYHQRYYADWWLSLPMPLLIASLAWLQARTVRSPAQSAKQSDAHPLHTETNATDKRSYPCGQCDAILDSPPSLASHVRWSHRNGHKKKEKVAQ